MFLYNMCYILYILCIMYYVFILYMCKYDTQFEFQSLKKWRIFFSLYPMQYLDILTLKNSSLFIRNLNLSGNRVFYLAILNRFYKYMSYAHEETGFLFLTLPGRDWPSSDQVPRKFFFFFG